MAKAIALAQPPEDRLSQLKAGPARLGEFLTDVRAETRKVITPTREEVQTTTGIVIATVFVFAAYFWLVDSIVGRAVDLLFKQLVKQ